jgi:hypothetical protein
MLKQVAALVSLIIAVLGIPTVVVNNFDAISTLWNSFGRESAHEPDDRTSSALKTENSFNHSSPQISMNHSYGSNNTVTNNTTNNITNIVPEVHEPTDSSGSISPVHRPTSFAPPVPMEQRLVGTYQPDGAKTSEMTTRGTTEIKTSAYSQSKTIEYIRPGTKLKVIDDSDQNGFKLMIDDFGLIKGYVEINRLKRES